MAERERVAPPRRARSRSPNGTERARPGGHPGGEPLAPIVAWPIQRSLGVDTSGVRVHSGAGPARSAQALGARAFAYGRDVFLGGRERPTDLPLVAHEVAHVVQQQGAPALQRAGGRSGDRYEREADSAAGAVTRGERFAVRERTPPRVQRLGLSDVLDYFADKANAIPGFRMFTIILGVNPVNMSRVERSAANIMRAVVEFLPGGYLITQALDNHGIFEKVGGWVEQQIKTLGMTGSVIREAINRFLDSLSWRDIFDLGGVWDRAKRIFSEPIRRLIDFATGLVTGIIRFIKDAILRPLAKLAEGTRGWDLLKAVLGEDPITGERVPRTADTLIGGFMKLIGQEEVWENIKKAKAIPRAWAWFQGALQGLLGFVRGIPALFISALQQLELMDIVVVPRAFKKIGRVFGGFILSFLSWAGQQVLSLLQIIFEVVAPAVMPYLRKAMGAFKQIVSNPIGFIKNLVRAGIQGFKQFGSNFLTHLRTSLIQWLTGTLAGAGIYIPQAFELREIIKFVLSVLGLTWDNIRSKLVKLVGETAVKVLETGVDIVVTLVKEGPAAAWDKIREQISNLKEMVMEQIMSFVRDRIVQAAITKLVTSLNPAGAFIQAIIAIYNTVMFFVERLRQIAQVVASFIDSISAIAAGAVGAAANRVEQTMAGLLTLVIGFLARIVGLGKVSDAVANIVKKIRAPIDKALDRVVEWIGTMAKKIGGALSRGAKAVAGKVLGWLGLKKEVRADGETHMLSFRNQQKPELILASEPEHMGSWINRRKKELQTAGQWDSTKQNAHDAIRQDLIAIGRLSNPKGTPAAVADQERDVNAALSRIAKSVAIIGFGGAQIPVPRMVVTPGFSTSPAADITVQFLFSGRGNHPAGRPTTGRESLGGAWAVLEGLGISRRFWKSGHILNAELGGPPIESNLIPIPASVNTAMEAQFDSKVKRDLYDAGKPIWMKFTVQRGHANDPPKHFITAFEAQAGEMVNKSGTYVPPTQPTATFRQRPIAFPAPPTALSLNALIATKDPTRREIIEVARSSQLERRLVTALVERGTPLTSVDPGIPNFIKSKRVEWGDARVTGYLANFDLVKSGIKL